MTATDPDLPDQPCMAMTKSESSNARLEQGRDFSNRILLERAFELAGTAGCNTVAQIRSALLKEGYSHFQVNQLALSSLRGQLQARIAKIAAAVTGR